MDYSLLIDILSAALTPLIAIIAAYIAYQQWKTNKHSLKLDLYNHRLSVYRAVNKLLNTVIKKNGLSWNDAMDFKTETSEAPFFFGNDVLNFRKELFDNAKTLARIKEDLKNSIKTEKSNTSLIEEHYALITWFDNQFETSDSIFKKYLDLSK